MLNQVKTILLLGVISALLIAVGGWMGQGWLLGSIALALVMNVGGYWFSDRIVLAMSHARPVDEMEAPRLHAMVDELARRAGIPKPRLYVTPERQPNAFATGRNPEHGVVAVTEGIVDLLDERELRGVLAHEIAHIANRDILVSSIAAVMVGAISALANMMQYAMLFGGGRRDDDEGGNPLAALALLIVAPIAATLVQFAISRQREYLADETGARISGDPAALADALSRLHRGAAAIPSDVSPATASMYIVNPFTGVRGLVNLFSTHPPMEERVARLLAMRATR
jgi:heat shock protein HtpX